MHLTLLQFIACNIRAYVYGHNRTSNVILLPERDMFILFYDTWTDCRKSGQTDGALALTTTTATTALHGGDALRRLQAVNRSDPRALYARRASQRTAEFRTSAVPRTVPRIYVVRKHVVRRRLIRGAREPCDPSTVGSPLAAAVDVRRRRRGARAVYGVVVPRLRAA
jgi:hypothetical protein